MQHLPTNALLQGGKYKIERILGQGGFGITYLATQTMLGRTVCIKEFFLKDFCSRMPSGEVVNVAASNKESFERFLNKFIKEAQMIAQMDNAHIIPIHDVFEENGTAYYVMKYIEGGTLENLVQQSPLSVDNALHYIKQIANALQYCHLRNVLHLDIKPSNVLIQDNIAILIDFGISKRYDDIGSQTSSTPVGISRGYAPLEQYNIGGVSNFSPATDIYSLGATLYKLLTGVTPPDANEINEDGLPPLPQHIPTYIQEAIVHAMRPRRKSRLQSVDEFLCSLSMSSSQVIETDATKLAKEDFDPEKIDEYRRLAEQGHAHAQFNLGLCYLEGEGVDHDYIRAENWFRKAAKQGYSCAQYVLGNCYKSRRDIKQAIKWYSRAAEQGDEYAQLSLGDLYYNGDGVEQDYAQAVMWYQKAAEQENEEAQYNLGVCYYNGKGIEQDYSKAIIWYQKAAEQGNDAAKNALGKCYYSGRGVEQDYAQAVKWFREPAKYGYADAQFALGLCYYEGYGVEKNYAQSVVWYQKSAEQGDIAGQTWLGYCYENGKGVEEDKAKAAEWYRKAAEQGNAYAQCSLANFYKDGIGVEKDLALAVLWYKKSADQQHERAMQALADCYYYGKGIEENKEEAIYIYKTLVGKGNEKAIEAIKKIEEEENYDSWEKSWKGRIYHFLEKPLKWLPSREVLFVCMLVWLVYFLLKDGGVIKDFFGFSTDTEFTILCSFLIVMLFSNWLKAVRGFLEYNKEKGAFFLSFFYLIAIVVICFISQSLSNVSDVSNQSIPIDKESTNVSQQHTNSVEEESVVSATTPLFVSTTPSGVSVYVDGQKIGTTPIEGKEISRGSHKIKLSKVGYQDKILTRTFSNKPVIINETLAEIPKPVSSGQINGHDYVDLGLSVKWATCNIGASSPSDYGNYYAWGETSTKSEYNRSNSKTQEMSIGSIAGNSSYDAARAHWGGTWRLPTYTECSELRDKCTWIRTTQGGNKGYKVTGKNGKSIFLPAAGWRSETSLVNDGYGGYYWSAEPHPDEGYTSIACRLSFHSDGPFILCFDRYAGSSVRPVTN